MEHVSPISVLGPALPFETLFDVELSGPSEGLELHPDFAAVYGGPLRLRPATDGLPLLAMNFVAAHDGRVAFNHPDHRGGGPISGFDDNDVWLMGLIPARVMSLQICWSGFPDRAPDKSTTWTSWAPCSSQRPATCTG